ANLDRLFSFCLPWRRNVALFLVSLPARSLMDRLRRGFMEPRVCCVASKSGERTRLACSLRRLVWEGKVRDGEGAIASTRGACAPQRKWRRRYSYSAATRPHSPAGRPTAEMRILLHP